MVEIFDPWLQEMPDAAVAAVGKRLADRGQTPIVSAGIDWSAIYMRDEFQVSPFLAGFAVALGAFTQAVTRFFADPFVER